MKTKRERFKRLGVLFCIAVLCLAGAGCQDKTPPGMVTGLTATAGNAQVTLAWVNPADADLAGIKVLRKTGSAPASPADGTVVFDGLATGANDAGLVNGTQYFYAAFAYDAKGNYAAGAQASATPIAVDSTPPGPVTGFSATAGNAQVALAWTNPSDADLAGIKVLRKTGSSPVSQTDGIAVYTGLGTSYTDTSVVNSTQYFYAAFAYDGANNYSAPALANATPMGDITPPPPVTGFTATAGDAEVELAWANPADADLAGVKILRKTGSAPTSNTDGNVVFNDLGTGFTDASVNNGTEYFYAAYAYDTADNYSAPAQDSATPTSATAEEEVLGNFEELAELVEGAVHLTPEQIAELLDPLEEAEAEYRGGDPCGSAELLFEGFLPLAQEFRVGPAIPEVEEYYNIGRMIRFNIASGFTFKSDCPGLERVGLEAESEIEEPTNRELVGSGLFGEPLVLTVIPEVPNVPEEVFTQVFIPGAESVLGMPGAPNVPVFRRLLAVPRGADVEAMISKAEPRVAEEIYMNLYPAQEEPVDQSADQAPDPSTFEDKPFFKDPARYASDEPYPPKPVTLAYLGNARDMEYYLVEVATGQYIPSTNKFTLFENVNFELQFEGGEGKFITEGMLNPFESGTPVLTEAVINKEVIKAFVEGRIRPNLTGEEFMILTHPDFFDAAVTLRDWKRSKGIWTNIYECGTGSDVEGRETKEEIDAFIEDHYDSVFIRPSYILLLGDAEFIAPFYLNSIGTDWPYAILGTPGTDTIPDFALGRIPVDTLDQANTVIGKIVSYEQNPVNSPPFYANAALASQFQCCRDGAAAGTDQRTFIEVSEFARNVMVSAGKNVDRIYTETGTATPTRYYNGTLLPAALGSGSGFAWNGSTANITNAWNDGRFLIMHRDHGWQGGWSHPDYGMSDIDSLNNGAELPVVFSVNCASGFFDNETAGGAYGTSVGGVYFCEKLLRKSNGGAVGILGDTRNSPSWANSTLTQGFFDAIWPSAIGSFGGSGSLRRLGDILNHGKIYLMSKVGISVMGEVIDSGSAVNELYLWHCLGDPTMEIWTRNPYQLILPVKFNFEYLGVIVVNEVELAQGINIEYPENGAEITVYQEIRKSKVPIGRGVVKNGVAAIEFNENHDTRLPLEVIANAENAKAQLITPEQSEVVFAK